MEVQELPHTAIPTWSGFIYQGRVALYHVLQILNNKTEDEVNELSIQLDSLEDFAIMKNDAGNKKPISLHQVKAVNSKLYSKYEDDFKKLVKKKDDTRITDVRAYFHLAVKNDETKQEIALKHNGLEIYCYEHNEEFCSLENINIEIRNKIREVLQKYDIQGHGNADNIELLYEGLEKIISDKVIYIHFLNHCGTAIRDAAFNNCIELKMFLAGIHCDIAAVVQNEEYFERKIRNNLNRYYQEFCFKMNDQLLTDVVKYKMDGYLHLFNSCNSVKFKGLLQNIRPHKEIAYSNLQQYTDQSLNEDEVKDAFFIILKEMKESSNHKMIGWKCNNAKNYLPTSIKESNSETGKRTISTRIMETALTAMVDVPYNADYLVTAECNVDSIEQFANRISDIDVRESNKIINWKKLSLIDLQTAKNNIND